jgi:predicted nucleic-acid-binding Zn-ribbon protein
MLSESELKAEITKLLLRELQGFRCPVCRHHEFTQLDDIESDLRTNLMLYVGSDPIPKKHARLISIACSNCGHIEQFAELPLRRRVLAATEDAP